MTKLELLAKVKNVDAKDLENLNNYKSLQKQCPAMYRDDCTDKEKIMTVHSMIDSADVDYKSKHPLGLRGEVKDAWYEMLREKGYDKAEVRKIRMNTFFKYEDTEGYYEFALKRLEEIVA